MALLKYTENEITYAQADGKLYGVKYNECYGKNGKPFARFSIAYDYEKDEFGDAKNKYLYCATWGELAELINYFSEQNKLRVKVSGKLKTFECNGEQREQLECTWVEPLYEIPAQTKQVKKKPKDEFDEFDI